MLIRLAGLFCWAFGVWVLLTWTLTAEQLIFGAVVAAAVVALLAGAGRRADPLGDSPAHPSAAKRRGGEFSPSISRSLRE